MKEIDKDKIISCHIAERFRYYEGKHSCGKTTFMTKELIEEALNGKKIFMVSFDDYDFSKRFADEYTDEEKGRISQNFTILKILYGQNPPTLEDISQKVLSQSIDILAIDDIGFINPGGARNASVYNRDFIKNQFIPLTEKCDIWFTTHNVEWFKEPFNYLSYFIQKTEYKSLEH